MVEVTHENMLQIKESHVHLFIPKYEQFKIHAYDSINYQIKIYIDAVAFWPISPNLQEKMDSHGHNSILSNIT